MKTTLALTLVLALAVSALSGCSKDTPAPKTGAAVVSEASPVRSAQAALPSVFEVPELKGLATAADQALAALVTQAQAEQDPAQTLALANTFVAARDALRNKIEGNDMRHKAFREIVQKNLTTTAARKAYARAMDAQHKAANAPAAPAVAAPK